MAPALPTLPVGRRLTARGLLSGPTLPALAAVVVFVIWAGSQGGYPPVVWYPGALFVLALLAITAALLPTRWRELPASLRVALVCFAAYTAWSYASIAWASQQGEAWDGANRTLLYLAVFALFATWRQSTTAAAVVLGAWTLGVTGVAIDVLVRLANSAHPTTLFLYDRLSEPIGYPNAAAATWLMALLPALVLAARRELPWWLRGVFGACGVVLADVALLSQSRGSVLALPIALAFAFALVRFRVRLVGALAPVALAVGATAPTVLHIGERLRHGAMSPDVVRAVTAPLVLAALAAGALIAAGAAWERYSPPRQGTQQLLHRLVAIAAAIVVVAGVATGVALGGGPAHIAKRAWHSFRHGSQPFDPTLPGSRLTSGLGSARYDFYRVALDRFAAQPLKGIGADNYAQDYLRYRHSEETPRYPHSIELRALTQTGIVGALLLAGALGGALACAVVAVRRAPPLRAAVAAGGLLVAAYWLVHGSFDWFWEFAGLGAPALAMLGLACSMRGETEPDTPHQSRRARGLVFAVSGLAAGAVTLTPPWLAERNVQTAAKSWPADLVAALHRLDRAAQVDPLSDHAQLVAGSIALRVNDLQRARREFEAALRRDPHSDYATLELGAIASVTGDPVAARALLARALELNPRDPSMRAALAGVRAGRRIDIAALNDRLFRSGDRLTK